MRTVLMRRVILPLLLLCASLRNSGAAPLNHIMIVWGENKGLTATLAQPYLAALAASYSQFSNYHGLTHPSQPNYVGFACGTLAVTANVGCVSLTNTNLVDLLEAKGVDWREYEESMTTACVDTALYMAKHDFFAGFTSISGDPPRMAKIRSFNGATPATYSELMGTNPPPLVMVTPNMCNDGHDCGVAQFNSWLKPGGGFTFFQDMLSSKYYTDGAIIVTFDEDDGTGGNVIYCVAVSALAKPGHTISNNYNHYNLLRTVEDNFALGTLTANDAGAANMLAAFNPAAVEDWELYRD
ncbi:MAG: alkaline phosphatase family protein [Candidatus Sumerlaeaceae bacterium]|nr:alkaline phosphatase family protein [Candidatus Sumerlaeaceae bacterium]